MVSSLAKEPKEKKQNINKNYSDSRLILVWAFAGRGEEFHVVEAEITLDSDSDAKVQFSLVLQQFLKNREPNRQSLCWTEPEPEPNWKNRFFWFYLVLKPVQTAEPIPKPNLPYVTGFIYLYTNYNIIIYTDYNTIIYIWWDLSWALSNNES